MKITYLFCFTLIPFFNSIGNTEELILTGEYTDIQFGRELINRKSFPTVKEFEDYAMSGDTSLVLMFSLTKSSNNLFNPIWSSDGNRLSFQNVQNDRKISRLFAFSHLGMKDPISLSNSQSPYDYMFRWGIGNPSAFIFTRLEQSTGEATFLGNFNTYTIDGATKLTPLTSRTLGLKGNLYANPAIYVRTDKIARIAFDKGVKILRVATKSPGKTSTPREVIKGQTPRWSRDGRRLLTIDRDSSGNTTGRMTAVNIISNEVQHFGPKLNHARSPCWSPDEQWVSCYVRKSGSSTKWSISVVPVNSGQASTMIDEDIIVNANYETQGPCWNPTATQLWYFSKEQHDEAYYPIVIKNLQSGDTELVDYPSECTSPTDITMNLLSPEAPEIAFSGRRKKAQHIFVLMLNHF